MPLPNPSMSFSPFAILTAEEMNDLVENIEALADGSGLNIGAVSATKIDFTTFLSQTGTGTPWVKLNETTTGSAGDTMSVTFTAHKYLKVFIFCLNSGSIQAAIRFNNDSTNTYSRATYNFVSSGYSTAASANSHVLLGALSAPQTIDFEMVNLSGQTKMFTTVTSDGLPASAAAAPGTIRSGAYYWSGTAQVNRIDVINTSTGDFASGSKIIVFGHDG